MIKTIVDDNGFALEIPSIDNEEDYVSASCKMIENYFATLFPHVLLDDKSVSSLYSDLNIIYDNTERNVPTFLQYIPKFVMLYKRLYDSIQPRNKDCLNLLFLLLNTNLLGNKRQQIIELFSRKPSNKFYQRQYGLFKEKHRLAKDLDFTPEVLKLKTEHLLWSENRDSKCFNLHWLTAHIQNFYDLLRSKKCINKDTDIVSFAHILTGIPYSQEQPTTPIDWICKEKQSLAMFIGLLKEAEGARANKLTWGRASELFTWNGEKVTFISSTQFLQAKKSGKYSHLSELIALAKPQEKEKKE